MHVCVRRFVSDLEILSKQKREKLRFPRVNNNIIVLSFRWNATAAADGGDGGGGVVVRWLRLLLGARKISITHIVLNGALCTIKHSMYMYKYIVWFSSMLLSRFKWNNTNNTKYHMEAWMDVKTEIDLSPNGGRKRCDERECVNAVICLLIDYVKIMLEFGLALNQTKPNHGIQNTKHSSAMLHVRWHQDVSCRKSNKTHSVALFCFNTLFWH